MPKHFRTKLHDIYIFFRSKLLRAMSRFDKDIANVKNSRMWHYKGPYTLHASSLALLLQTAYMHKSFYKSMAAWPLCFQVMYPKMGSVGRYLKRCMPAYLFIWENVMPRELLDIYGYWQINWRKVYEKYLFLRKLYGLTCRETEKEGEGGVLRKTGWLASC